MDTNWLEEEPFDLQQKLKGELIELRPLMAEDWNDLFPSRPTR
jgi:hypothetical protein